MKNETCSDLIMQKMASRNEDLEEIYDKMNNFEDDEMSEEGMDEYANLPLEISEFRTIRVLFSTGGPSDWLDIKIDDDGEVLRVIYHYSDWFDHAETEVSKNSYLWQYAEEQADLQVANN